MDDQVTLPAYTDEVRELIKHDRNDEAIALCKHILTHYPKYIDAYRQIGEALLEKGDLDSAKDLFRRVLSADPENVVAYTGLSIIFERQQLIDEAIWHLERAYELAPGNPELQKELLRLYNEADVKAHARLKLTPGALGRIYAQEGLYAHALQEFRGIIATVPSRFDIRVALAETLWRMGRLSEATQVAQSILEQLPYCIKANLILGTAWKQVGLPESEHYLRRVQLLDPINQTATQLMGTDSPLPSLKALVPRYVETKPSAPPAATAMPDVIASSETESLETLTQAPVEELTTEVSEASEAPASELSIKPDVASTTLPPWLQTPFPEAKDVEPTTPSPASWLTQLRQGAENGEPSEEIAEQPAETTAAALEDQPAAEVESTQELPAWMTASTPTESEKPVEAPTPSWVPQEPTAEPAQASQESRPSWLSELAKTETAKEAEETVPPWMADTSAVKPTEPEKIPPAWIPKEVPTEPEKAIEENLPPWMADTSAAKPTEPEKATSSWLAEASATEPEKESEESVPSWMADVSAIKPAEPEKTTPSWIPKEAPTEPEKTAEQVLPTWITENPTEPVAEQPQTKEQPPVEPVQAVEPQANQPLPSWLENLAQSTKAKEEEIPPTPPVESVHPIAEPEPFLSEALPPAPEPVANVPSIVVEMPSAEKPAPKAKRQPKGYSNLAIAREHRAANRFDDAMKEYDYIVQRAPRLVNQVIDDLEGLIQQRLDAPLEAHRILGDAYTRADRLAEALEQYRFVLEHTSK